MSVVKPLTVRPGGKLSVNVAALAVVPPPPCEFVMVMVSVVSAATPSASCVGPNVFKQASVVPAGVIA